MQEVDSTHRWNNEGYCKGCCCHVHDPKARAACERPYRPRARRYRSGGLSTDPNKLEREQ